MRARPTIFRSVRIFLTLVVAGSAAHGVAQSAVVAAEWPQAPSAMLQAAAPAATPAGTEPAAAFVMVNGRPYHKPSRREDFRAYVHELVGPRPFIAAAVRGGIEQARDLPVGWGQDFPGYVQRYGSAFGEAGIDTSVRYGLAAVLHEDVRYLICHHCSAGDKFENAFLAEFTARHGDNGVRSFSVTPIVASFSGPLVAYSTWYPAGYTTEQALKHSTVGFSTRVVFHLVREFFFDRDTAAEKAAAKAGATVPREPTATP